MTEYCEWSDLPVGQCAHCNSPEPEFMTIREIMEEL